MEYAEVSVNSPVAQRQTFSYAIPPNLNLQVGQAVLVPFGDKELQGIVLELTSHSPVTETREIAGIVEPYPLLSASQVQLARWISEYYLSPLFEAVALMLPPGFKRKLITYLSTSPSLRDKDLPSLSEEQLYVLDLLSNKGQISLKELEKSLGNKRAQSVASQLVRQGLAVRSYELEAVRVKPKMEPYLSLKLSADEVKPEIARLLKKRATRQAALLSYLASKSRPVVWAETRRETNCSWAIARTQASKGWITIEQVEVRRAPFPYHETSRQAPLSLTAAQERVLAEIKSGLETKGSTDTASRIFLLHGVTGSGKTEVYLQALDHAIKLGKKGIVLVPEIALTPQTIERFAARFPQQVAVLHSKLSLGEQFDEWQRIRKGDFDVVIGPRSAIFAPQSDLGIIVIDEEHEWTYKQQDTSPRYQTRDVALKLAEKSEAVVILGSATPDVETFYHAQRGKYHRLELPERVVPEEGSPLPEVEIVDLRKELKTGNRSIFSRSLFQAITTATGNKEQVILFLNRRGGATFIQCRNCGYVLTCRRCAVSLTYHITEDMLTCHQCNYRIGAPQACPRCSSLRIKFLGTGTQKLEQAARESFPKARLLRWDSDAIRKKDAHQEILKRFRAHEADILIGTQMIAKGLDLPLVTLVGVVNADISLNLPDFRAGERTFQLLSQVLGRAGRGTSGGKVILQTYFPEHYAIQAAAKHNYTLFYEHEINYRFKLRNPPTTRLARLTYSHTSDILCQRGAERLRERLSQEVASQGIDNLSLIGPAPAFVHRLRGRFRWQIILRGAEPSAFLSPIPMPPGWVVDIDPVGLS